MADHNISDVMGTTIEKIKTMIDADTIVGEQITVDGVTIIPVSKMCFGYAGGATDFGGKGENGSKCFAGGGGAGATITPIGFLTVKNGNVKMVPVDSGDNAMAKAIDMLPEGIEKIKELFKKDKTETKE